jgi:hypothetical protein
MKKFLLPIVIFVFSTAAFGQNDLQQIGKIDDIDDIREENQNSTKRSGDESVARVLDDEFERLGYTDSARLSILGDVGRENNWNRNIIFNGHSDPKNKVFNRGIISWQGQRRKKLDSYLKQEGLLGHGDDAELRGMARFMNSELQDEYPDVYMELLTAEDTASASNALQKYIKYVPKRPYNSPHPKFKVRKNAVWARKAMVIGLPDSPTTAVPPKPDINPDSQTTALAQKSDVSLDMPNGSQNGAASSGDQSAQTSLRQP